MTHIRYSNVLGALDDRRTPAWRSRLKRLPVQAPISVYVEPRELVECSDRACIP